jgi:SAM-dependent methyltransferase
MNADKNELEGREGRTPSKNHDERTPVVESHSKQMVPWELSFYLFIESQCAGRVVIDLSLSHSPGPAILKQAGAVEVLSGDLERYPLPFPSGSADLVLAGLSPMAAADERLRNQMLGEIRRLLRPNGFAIIRTCADSLGQTEAGTNVRALLTDILLEHFATVEIVEETPFSGDSFFASGCDDLVVSEALARLTGNPSFLIGLCGQASIRPWVATESLLVPTRVGKQAASSEGEIAVWRAEVERLTGQLSEAVREREELRERIAVRQDFIERSNELVSRLRKEVARYQHQLSDETTARELLAIERQQAQQKQQLLEAELEKRRWELVRLEASVHALEKEVARLRAARGELPGVSRSPS